MTIDSVFAYVQEHDNLMASLPPEQRADVPLLTVAWPAMWQGE